MSKRALHQRSGRGWATTDHDQARYWKAALTTRVVALIGGAQEPNGGTIDDYASWRRRSTNQAAAPTITITTPTPAQGIDRRLARSGGGAPAGEAAWLVRGVVDADGDAEADAIGRPEGSGREGNEASGGMEDGS
ncbi:hypothetical protein GCM10010399_62370 [Dactylosporangium fulvum]|uniref:Uncharacterized protein n=1 Tax=Dactylosporangium fulvum TaxID=53359 RepID=A0ABY5VZP4_9ACTN|nr:hypothetical protein [Dactylosporangium fulvum]UWP82489.1 hypothetical protein Dfulv_46875 [Dactylosporangium fulvum]